jgi:hypothetical protein
MPIHWVTCWCLGLIPVTFFRGFLGWQPSWACPALGRIRASRFLSGRRAELLFLHPLAMAITAEAAMARLADVRAIEQLKALIDLLDVKVAGSRTMLFSGQITHRAQQ